MQVSADEEEAEAVMMVFEDQTAVLEVCVGEVAIDSVGAGPSSGSLTENKANAKEPEARYRLRTVEAHLGPQRPAPRCST